MANFTLSWNVNQNGNVLQTRAGIRKKTTGGSYSYNSYINAPFDNPETDTFTGHDDNAVYQFVVQNVCETGGPTTSSLTEGIKFACPGTKSASGVDHDSATLNVSGLPTDITKVRYSVRDIDANTVVAGPTNVNTSSGAISDTVNGLTGDTDYRFEIQLIAVVNGSEVTSSLSGCYVTFTTDPVPECPTATGLTVS